MGKTLEEINVGKKKYLFIIGITILLLVGIKSLYGQYESMKEGWVKRKDLTKDKQIEVNDRSIYDIDQTTALKNTIEDTKLDFNTKLEQMEKEREGRQKEILENQKIIDEQQKEIIALRSLDNKAEKSMNTDINNDIKSLKEQLKDTSKELDRLKKEKELSEKLKPNDMELPALKGALADVVKETPKATTENIDLKLNDLKVTKTSSNDFFKLGSDKKEAPEENGTTENVDKKTKNKLLKDDTKKEDDLAVGPKMDLMLGLVDATLVMGVDAPTNIGTKNSDAKDPLPVLLSVSSDALIANNYRQDYKNCLILATATGNATTERAYLRLSKLSCVNKSGDKRVEANIEGWVVGEDNKAGISGNLVTKSGALILRGLMAGVAEGLANATSNTNNYISPTTSYGNNNYSPANNLVEGFGTGAGNAFKTIADFYIEMAKDMYPVIEVRGGRKVQILIKGTDPKSPIREVPYNKMFINSDYELDVNQNVSIKY